MKTRIRRTNLSAVLALTALVLILFIQPALAQQNMQDVVYLKNGNILRGIIIEQIPNQSIKIKTNDGNVFTHSFDEIEKITKEEGASRSAYSGTITYPLPDRSLLINPLGFIQFGPIVEAEFKIAPNTVFGPHLRFSSLGLLYHLIVDYDELTSGMAFGVHAKRFYGGVTSPNRFYVGSFLEYGWGTGTDDWGEYKHAYISLLSNFGHRWYFSSMYMNVGLIAGVAYEIQDEAIEPYSVSYSKDIFFLGMVELSIGFTI